MSKTRAPGVRQVRWKVDDNPPQLQSPLCLLGFAVVRVLGVNLGYKVLTVGYALIMLGSGADGFDHVRQRLTEAC